MNIYRQTQSRIQYLLQRIDQHLRKGPPVDYSKMTIEHVAPENPPPGVAITTGVGRLGNLLLLHEQGNDKVANKAFAEKKTLYSSASACLDPNLKSAAQWTTVEIDNRTKALAKLGYEQIFRV